MCICVPFIRWSLHFYGKSVLFLLLFLSYPYFDIFPYKWSLSLSLSLSLYIYIYIYGMLHIFSRTDPIIYFVVISSLDRQLTFCLCYRNLLQIEIVLLSYGRRPLFVIPSKVEKLPVILNWTRKKTSLNVFFFFVIMFLFCIIPI